MQGDTEGWKRGSGERMQGGGEATIKEGNEGRRRRRREEGKQSEREKEREMNGRKNEGRSKEERDGCLALLQIAVIKSWSLQ